MLFGRITIICDWLLFLFFITLMFGVTEVGFVDACGMALMLFSLQLMALLKRRLASAGESLFVSTKSDTKNDPDKPSKAR
ncbi:hypothetical protein [Rheinheimera sp.]|jgi:hypothetical protein|uniref:hypothetical protein n=1 Tax=Rheinheimera sp. TaxID=1869214 RepID=UPI003AF93A8A